MHTDLRRLTTEIRQAMRDLGRGPGYHPGRLYEFRVAIRRIRSMLKHRASKRAQRLRKTWGGFAAVTNRARDWDVFLSTAEQRLDAARLEQFRQLSEEPVQKSRDAVTRMLQSAYWRAHLKEWNRFVERARKHGGPQDAAAPPAAALDAALARARASLALALQQDDDTAWHKFRIAVKEVRYTAERQPLTAASIIESCKALQSLLGGWHDCVIQLQLLDELEPSPLAQELREITEELRRQRLAEIRAAVTRQSLFSQPARFNPTAGPTPS